MMKISNNLKNREVSFMENIIQQLQSLGFNQYESKVYVTLVKKDLPLLIALVNIQVCQEHVYTIFYKH